MEKTQLRSRARNSNRLRAALATTMIATAMAIVAPAITSLSASAQIQVTDVSDLAERLLPSRRIWYPRRPAWT